MALKEFYDNVYNYGCIRYFKGTRLFNDKALFEFNKGKIKAKELVTFDCALMELEEIKEEDIEVAKQISEQVLAIIVRPEIAPSYRLENTDFEFCGYDLVNYPTGISAITNCGADWGNALNYVLLNQYGLFSDYRQAVTAQLDLDEQYPDESHAYCEIIEIWRLLA